MTCARHVLAPLVALLALAAATGIARPATSPPGCRPAQLSGRVASSSGAAGTILLGVVLRNASHATCSMRGYPRLRLYRPHRWLPTHVSRGGLVPLDRPARTIVLHPGDRATLLVAYSDVPRGSAPCLQATTLFVSSVGRLAGTPASTRRRPPAAT